jgi:hypothetical protein
MFAKVTREWKENGWNAAIVRVVECKCWMDQNEFVIAAEEVQYLLMHRQLLASHVRFAMQKVVTTAATQAMLLRNEYNMHRI